MTDAPRRISGMPVNMDITGYALPWKDEQPVMLQVTGADELSVPVFSTQEKAEEFRREFPGVVDYDKLKKIDNMWEFLSSIPEEFHVIVDPHRHENGKVRYKLIQR